MFKRMYFCLLIAILFVVIVVDEVSDFKYSFDVAQIVLDLEMPTLKNDIIDTRVGDLTGYAADCPACNGTLACKRDYNVYKNGVITYNDDTYGDVRIVASSKNLACGSIIKFSSSIVGETYAIVMDRGVLGNNIDLLVESENYASKFIGRSKISYDVLRNGW